MKESKIDVLKLLLMVSGAAVSAVALSVGVGQKRVKFSLVYKANFYFIYKVRFSLIYKSENHKFWKGFKSWFPGSELLVILGGISFSLARHLTQ